MIKRKGNALMKELDGQLKGTSTHHTLVVNVEKVGIDGRLQNTRRDDKELWRLVEQCAIDPVE